MSPILEAAIVRPELAADFDTYEAAPARTAPQGFEAKRLLDILGASAAFILCAPVMILIFLGLCFQGNPIFAQQRVGRGGKLFRCYKFRTMINGAEQVLADYLEHNPAAREEWRLTFKLTNDPRITPMGHFLRKSSLDELPQLFNILKGEMSLVGPRPIVVEEFAKYQEHFYVYASGRPGLTGLWQIKGRNDTTYAERVAFDVEYVRNWSLRRDVAIVLMTVKRVLQGRGAY